MMLLVRVAGTLKVVGLKEAATVTWTTLVSGPNPVAEAVMKVEPIATPVTCGLVAPVCAPCGTKMPGVMVATVGSAEMKAMVTPPGPAGEERLTARLED